MVRLYNEQPEEERRKAPHVLGHPKDNAPAYGWVGELKREGKILMASCIDMAQDFIEGVNKGSYKFRSASIYPNGLLRHVGWLGAVQPAVSGLGEVAFNEEEDYIAFEDFMEWDTRWRFERLAAIMQRFREWIIESNGIETADKIMPAWDVDSVRPPLEQTPEFNQSTPSPTEDDMKLEEQVNKLSADFAQAQAENKTLKDSLAHRDAQIASLTKAVDDLNKAQVKAGITNYCDGLIAAGKMLPTERDYFIGDLTEKALASAAADYAEGASPIELAKAMLEKRTAHKLFDAIATPERAPAAGVSNYNEGPVPADPQGADLDSRIRKYMKENNVSDYAEALDAVVELQGGVL
jgi:hypothetical protein